MGVMCWHCHAGIFTYPVQIAVKYKIPLLIWGEQGFLDLGGMFSHKDLVEMTEKFRTEHGLRGYDWKDMIDAEEGITEDDLAWAKYPSDEEIEKVGIRGIYLGNYFPWDNVKQTELMIKEFGFKPSPEPYDRTYTRFENVECWHCNGVHDYLRYLKFGYGRCTDHVCQDIRLGRMTRTEGFKLAEKYDKVIPKDVKRWLDFVGLTEKEFK